MKQWLKEEGNETVTNCNGLKMPAIDGKMENADVADAEQLNSYRIFINCRIAETTIRTEMEKRLECA